MKLSDLVSLRPIPAVVQANDVRALRNETDSDAARDFVRGYLGFDDRSRAALDAAVRSLASQSGAWFFNGVFGSGKSHLLGVLALLCDNVAHDDFAALHPHLAPALKSFAPRLVVHFSLDEYPASQFSLEEIFWREVRAEWSRRGFSGALNFAQNESRSETFAALEEVLRAHQLQGLVVCIDELSLFLSGREHRALQNDAAFLQFLGQRARRRSSDAPLWIFAALQKTVEDIGDLDGYAISQIRDRFTTLPLSLAHLPSLIEQRLVTRNNEAALRELCNQTYDELARALPRLDFGRDEWQRLYPFHPATVSLLESAATRYGSRTRSAVLFCSQAVNEGADARTRITSDALFDFWEPELAAHPDLKPLISVWIAWQNNLDEIATDANEKRSLQSLMKILTLWKIAGVSPSVIQLTNALCLDCGLPEEGNYKYARILLEKLRERGGSLAVERRDDPLLDRYTIDFGARVSEMARRFTSNALHTLPVGDRRIAAYALASCHDDSLPLAALQNAASTLTLWRNTPRNVRLELAATRPAADVLANRLAALQAPDGDDFALWIVPPFSAMNDENRDGDESEAWRSAMREAVATTGEARWRSALVRWTPRAPSHDEWQVAREATAQHLLLGDPQLHDNRRGRAVLDFLKNGQSEREVILARLATRLLREGTLATASGAAIEAAELAGSESWSATLEAIAEWVLPGVFPRFESIAPRLRVLTSANAEALCLDILRRPADTPFFAASLERAARAIAEPLGVAIEERGRWKIRAPQNELAQAMRAFIESSGTATLAALEMQFQKSAWGLNNEQTRVVVCALLRGGELAAFDARGAHISTDKIGMPLRKAVHALRPGRLLDDAAWKTLANYGVLLEENSGAAPFGALSFAAQDAAYARLTTWRDEQLLRLQLAQARLHQLRRQFAGDANNWPRSEDTRERISQWLQNLSGDSAFDFLSRAAAHPPDFEALETWRSIEDKLDARHAALLDAHAFLAHAELVAPPELANERLELTARLAQGESVLDDETLLAQCADWREKYARIYTEWHGAQNAAPRWNSLRRLAASDELRIALKLGTLANRSFTQGDEVQTLLSVELAKPCARDGNLRGAEPVCAACRLKWNQRISVKDARELEAILESGADALRAALTEEVVQSFLMRDERGGALLQWRDAGEPLAALLPILDDATLQLLDEAFKPRRRALREIGALLGSFGSCRTRAQFERTFAAWLDGNDGLQSDDEIALQ